MYANILLVCLTVAVVLLGVLGARYWSLFRHHASNTQALTDAARRAESERREREKAESALQQKKEWSEILFNNTQDLVFIHGVTPAGLPGKFVQVNDVACRELGYARERLLTMTPMEIEDAPVPTSTLGYTRSELALLSDEEILERQNVTSIFRHLLARILEEKQVLYERVYVTRTGRRFPVEISARRFDLLNEPMIMCTAHDITERRKVHQALRESEQRFQDFFAHSPIGVAMYDVDRKLINVNPTSLKMFGTPDPQEFARFDLYENPSVPEEARRSLARGETATYEASIDFDDIRRQGLFVTTRTGKAHFDVLIHNMGLDQDFKPKGYIAQLQDVTRRREAEVALVHSERQLRQAQKMEAIGTLAGGIAHDFNNILTPIIGYTEMVIQTAGSGDGARDYLREVLKASNRAKDLVNQILTFSRQTEREGQPIQVSSIVKEVVKQFDATLPRNIEVRMVLKTENDVVVAHPTQLHQVLMNLCTNAVHAMKENGGTLEIRLGEVIVREHSRRQALPLAPGRYLRLSVKDSGCGMDSATVERIFEPFFTTKASGEGTGMGLAVVHGIVTSLKGTITVDTKPGEGSTFHVTLPAVERAEVKEQEHVSPVPGGSECVLFVDDEKDILKMESHMLSSLGYEPVVASSPAEALRLFQLKPDRFDLVITDQVMPGMTGLELARAMLAIRPDLPIVLCTGFSEAVTPEQAMAMGLRAFILKPIAMRQLADTIRKVLSPPDDAQPPAEVPESVEG